MKLKTLKNFKKLSFLLCITILFQLCGLGVIKTHAATQTKVTYTINGEAKVGNIIDIIVNVSDVTNLYAGSIDFVYDESLLKVQSISKGNIFGNNNAQEPINQVKNGQANLAFTLTGANNGVSGNGTLAVIKAEVLKEGTVNLKTSNSNEGIDLNGNTTRVKLVNSDEHAIDYNSEDTNINLKALNSFDTLTPGVYSNSNSNFNYTSNWTNVPDSQAYTNTTNESMSFTFEGTGFAWNSVVAPNRGIADIYIDNQLVKTVDTYSQEVVADFRSFEISNLNYSKHTAKIVATGNKSEASSDFYISIKSIEVFAKEQNTSLTVGSYSNTAAGLNYTSNWNNVPDSQAYTNTASESMSFTFEGTGFAWYSVVAPNRGIADVYIDDQFVKSVDTYSQDVIADFKAFEISNLNNSKHTAKIVASNRKNDASSDFYISIKSIDVFDKIQSLPLTVGLHTNMDAGLNYTSNWNNVPDSQAYTNTSNEVMSFSFEGTGFAWYSVVAPNRGIADVYVDNNLVKSVDTYSQDVIADFKAFEVNNLDNGNHNVRIIVTNNKNQYSSDYYISIKSIEVFAKAQSLPLTVGLYDNTTDRLNYTSNWNNIPNSQAYTNMPNESMSFNFEGTGFAWYSVVASNRGIANIYIDGQLVKSVDTYSQDVVENSKVFEVSNLDYSNHTAKIVVTGNKNDNSSDSYLSIKSIEVFDKNLNNYLKSGIYNNASPDLNFSSNWTNVPDSQAYTNIAGESLTFEFEGTGFAWDSIVAPNRGIANIYIDDVLVKTVDTYSENVVLDSRVFEVSNLEYKIHTAKIVVTGNKSESSSDSFISVHNIEVFEQLQLQSPTLKAGLYLNDNEAFNYTSNWTNVAGSQAYTNTSNESIYFNFEGTGFAWNSVVAPNRGVAYLYIDGKFIQAIDTYSENVISDFKVFEINNLENKKHTVEIYVPGEKSDSSSDSFVSLQSINVLN
ncbi:cellulosome anchor protein [Clostridium chauvoei]|uniref:cohesin domain-containing protein n=1 Tax=Clostridium chauvoei TaxID=46867 RepID=UPI00103FDB2C|nr:cohesin domain-containing protein [Clostridium chauvoei]QBJ74552.1 cellulosome anchor protein [Clostridium chauvoei]